MSYTIAVRALCEFTAKAGDLDLRFTPSPSSQEGIAGHAIVTSRRGDDYQTEVKLSGEYEDLIVRGRADGYNPTTNQLEEIKTYRGLVERIPDHHRQLHWAQAKIYGSLLCANLNLSGLTVGVTYFNVDTERETTFPEYFTAGQLHDFFHRECMVFLAWARQEIAHRSARDKALDALSFPLPEFRIGQRDLAKAAYLSICKEHTLLAQAPTGIGKTLATLFPALKAVARTQLDNIFFLTAKTTGRGLAFDALDTLASGMSAQGLRVLELTARDKLCEHPDKACHGDSCPLAAGFYDRLPAARAAAVARGRLDQAALRAVAAENSVCPYYLGQEMARWSDVIVGDYNYYFDSSALLFELVKASEWRTAILVDEAHSLVERARLMYTAELDQSDLLTLQRTAPAELKKTLNRLHRQWRALAIEQDCDYRVHSDPPHALLSALQHTVATVTDFLTEHPTPTDPALQNFYFNALHFCRLAESFDNHSFLDSTRYSAQGQPRLRFCLRNVVPASFLKPRFDAAHAAILFSATLEPRSFYQRLLGLPEQMTWIDVDTPFSTDQLTVHVANVSTRFQQRGDSIAPIVELIARQFRQRPGNYLAFFSSFDYLGRVAAEMQRQFGDIKVWTQERRMDEEQRAVFINRFTSGSQGIGFTVLGGVFSEGIDLPGQRLIGAFIVTLGIPQVNPVNEQMMQRTSEIFGSQVAYDYTYLIPGIRKVAQAGGRIVRTTQDEGILYLIDSRFREHRVRQLLPKWWGLPQIH